MKLLLSLSFILLLASQLLPSSVHGQVLVPTAKGLTDIQQQKVLDSVGEVPKIDKTDLGSSFHSRKFAVHIKRRGRGAARGGAVGTGSSRRHSAAFQTPISSLSLYLTFGALVLLNLF
ncbi:hypothetical protein IFM89_035289 [Coptis chinensis]|uniref:Uncharacterized protein n=1 Tax=Coptis chinensis TaxID=261450 RepID=A0A835IKH2_9MAGN|nr:hypothetical protein IFM89_035289 [Coptis chinensis]